jgi:HSP20 family molecular chaperone IbpA
MFGRGFFDPSFRSIIRDMERTMNHLYQDIGRNNFNQTMLPRAIPHASLADDQKPVYRLNVDMAGFRPEEIKGRTFYYYYFLILVGRTFDFFS